MDLEESKSLLTRHQATEYLAGIGFPVTGQTLAYEAWKRRGPPYFRFGRDALYNPDELLEWARARLRVKGVADGQPQ